MHKDEIVTALQESWRKMLRNEEGKDASAKRTHVYASQWRLCDRRMVLDMVASDQLPPWDDEALGRFRRGKDRERELAIDLARVGRLADPSFEVEGAQERFELKNRKGTKVVMSGKVDVKIGFTKQKNKIPTEFKAWAPHLVARVSRFQDLFFNVWTRPGAYQLLMYLLGMREPLGFLILDRAGVPLPLIVELEEFLEEAESFWHRAEQASDHAEKGTLPDYIDDKDECKRCPFFGGVCNPPSYGGSGATVIDDEDLLAKIARHQELKQKLAEAGIDEYDDLDAEIKAKLRGVEMALAGNFLVTGKWGTQTTYDIPANLKAEYKKSNPKGKFTTKIDPL